jgi:hypothetical protein
VTARTVRIGIKVFFERRLGMRYLALVALLAFLAVPFMAGCDSGKAPAPKPVEKAKDKPTDVKPTEPTPPPTPTPPAPAPEKK